ncbi:MAG: ABC transporter permease [Muribaculaceae bacterium]|nr:ABC transporter permease [Muribaculaceae bacterium]
MNYLKQIYYEMRHHRMMTWVSISGTALAIFLVMTFVMAERINTVEMAPESNRSRIMSGTNLHLESNTNAFLGSTWGINPDVVKKLYGNLDGVEVVSYIKAWGDVHDVNVKGEESFACEALDVDENFWKVYDFRFIDGRPFDEAERKAEVKSVVITRSTARKLFGEEKVAGREIEIGMYPYTVIGVVEDVSPLLGNSYAKLYRIYNIESDKGQENTQWFGNTSARLLLKEGKSPKEVKHQVEERYRQLSSEAAKEGMRLIYHGQPYTAEDNAAGSHGSNNTPPTERHQRIQWVIYAILILVPAINLSSMTRSRLRHRVAEIGVRRAFGAKRVDIITQLFGENLIITFIGGCIGLGLSIIFLIYASTFLFSYSSIFDSLEILDTTPDLKMVFSWGNFFIALGICLVLNILSATVPAWRASLVDPATALSSR